jgi:hypothetical protein
VHQYLCLLYAPADDPVDRTDELPRWFELTDRLRAAGVLIANAPLAGVESATTVRVRDHETQLTDGPFATTKETVAGFYLLECADLDEALRHAAALPIAAYGSVEVRPVQQHDAPGS